MSNDPCQIDVRAINLEEKQARRAWLRSDSCFLQHRSVFRGLNSELSFSTCTTRECHKLLLFTRDVTFDARFLHSDHVASVQARVPVNLVDGAVCADSVLVTA